MQPFVIRLHTDISSSSETICSAPFTDKIRTVVHYIVNKELTIKSSVKKCVFSMR